MMTVKMIPFLLILLFHFTAPAQAGKHAYPDLAQELAVQADEILIKHGLCKDVYDCRNQDFTFRGGTPEYAIVTVYKSRQLEPVIIKEIMQLCLDAYYANNQNIRIKLKFYVETTQEKNTLFSGVKPLIQLDLKAKGD